MARLRNRIRKADYFSDGELLRWHRDKRQTYSGLYALAEDSGCLEDDTYVWKFLLWPSPLDTDITVELLTQWRDELVEAGKLVPYEANGQKYLYLKSFHTHEHPRNPQKNTLPLPPWIEWVPYGKHPYKGQYEVDESAIRAGAVVPPKGKTKVSAPAPKKKETKAGTEVAVTTGVLESEFEKWWVAYGRVGTKARAYDLYEWWRTKAGADFRQLMAAAVAYREHVAADDSKMMHASTFLAKPAKGKSPVWPEWATGEEHGTMNARSTKRLSDVIEAASRAFGLVGGEDERDDAITGNGSARALGSGEDAGRGVPARRVAG